MALRLLSLTDAARLRPVGIAVALFCVSLAGCGDTKPAAESETPRQTRQTPIAVAPDLVDPPQTIASLRAALGLTRGEGQFEKVGGEIVAADLTDTDVTTLEPLASLPIRQVFLEKTAVDSLAPLSQAPLEVVYAGGTPISDLKPLAGRTLTQLNLIDTPIADLSPLATCRLGTLWLRRCPVSDLTPLAETRLQSLDVQETDVADLAPLASMRTLRRLNIAGTPVVDVTPLAGLALQRIILSPERITAGMEGLRSMKTLEAIDTSFDGPQPTAMPAASFWAQYDAGTFDEGSERGKSTVDAESVDE